MCLACRPDCINFAHGAAAPSWYTQALWWQQRYRPSLMAMSVGEMSNLANSISDKEDSVVSRAAVGVWIFWGGLLGTGFGGLFGYGSFWVVPELACLELLLGAMACCGIFGAVFALVCRFRCARECSLATWLGTSIGLVLSLAVSLLFDPTAAIGNPKKVAGVICIPMAVGFLIGGFLDRFLEPLLLRKSPAS